MSYDPPLLAAYLQIVLLYITDVNTIFNIYFTNTQAN